MTKEDAIERVAAILAFNTQDHLNSAKILPNLRENAIEAMWRNRDAAEALGFLVLYEKNLYILRG